MNPQNPYYNNPSFYFHPPPIPNYQNPNYSLPQNHHRQTILPPNPSSVSSSTTAKDLDTTLSILKDFINQANTTLKSLPDHLLLLTQNHDELCCCPFNPNHKMLPEFLFHHFLICTSSPCVINLDILDSLHYPKSIKEKKNESIQPIEEYNDEICISIDDYLLGFRSNLFYKDCPAVVCSLDFDNNERTFKVPRVLFMLCSDFSDEGDTKVEWRECMKILPSECWAMRSEMEVWYEFPVSYSYVVNRVCRCLGFAKECEILKWIIMNSPRYGIVIDLHMRDHMYVLLKLCMKAIAREAYHTHKLLLTGNEGDRELDLKSLCFDCPVLREVMMWLSSQFTVLYGEVNGNLFSKELLKWCLLNAASNSLLYPLNEKGGNVCGKEGLDSPCVSDGKGLELVGSIGSGNVKVEDPDEKLNVKASVYDSSVFVSQVTAAVAALHERSLLEEKIKGLRRAGSLPKSQLLREYSYVSTRALEERRKRPNYRPILEHDGLLWQRYNNKDSNKSKTREELLAEERDYKRRRMSYRGKKVKRSKTEVLRDIIEVHMNEIKQAGGIGCFIKGSAEVEVFASGSMSVNDMPVVDMLKSNRDSSEPSNRPEYGYEKQSYQNHSVSARPEFVTPKDHISRSSDVTDPHLEQGYESQGQQDQEKSIRKNKQDKEYRCRSPESYRSRRSHERHRHHRDRDDQEESGISARKELGTPKDYTSRSSDAQHSHTRQGYESHGHHEYLEDHERSIRKNKQDKEDRSRCPESYRSRVSHERHRHQRERDDREGSRSSKYDKGSSVSSHRSRYHDKRSISSVSNPATDLSEGKNDQISDIIGYKKRRTPERYRSGSVRESVIDDRYDPSGSNNGFEDANDDPHLRSQYVRPDKSYAFK
ncbi:hypothetical protein MKX01_040996 [Papaver californicum]|nr:hypothetical protein MKX01_040996 [Papaver californicum]